MNLESLLSSFFGEFEGKALQRQGEISRDQILQFFTHGRQLFGDQEFKLGLAMGHRQKKNMQDIVDAAQAQVWEQKVTPAVQGDYGIASLSKIRQRFRDDAEILRIFYEFVHLEEKTMDEAEMPSDLYEKKYKMIYEMKQAMMKKIDEHKQELEKLPPQEQEKFMAQVYKTMVDQAPGGPGCGDGGCPSCQQPTPMAMPNLPPRPATLPPAPLDGPSHSQEDQCSSGLQHGTGAYRSMPGLEQRRVMLSDEEQLAFFQNLQRS